MTTPRELDEQHAAMDAIAQDSDPSQSFCGIASLWQLSAAHPFNEACRWHDVQYDLARKGFIKGESSEDVDREFYRRCVSTAGTDPILQSEALLFYKLCRVWGRFRWPREASA